MGYCAWCCWPDDEQGNPTHNPYYCHSGKLFAEKLGDDLHSFVQRPNLMELSCSKCSSQFVLTKKKREA